MEVHLTANKEFNRLEKGIIMGVAGLIGGIFGKSKAKKARATEHIKEAFEKASNPRAQENSSAQKQHLHASPIALVPPVTKRRPGLT